MTIIHPPASFYFQLMGAHYPVTRVSSTLLRAEDYSAHTPVGEIDVVLTDQEIVGMPAADLQDLVRRAFAAHERAWNGLGEYLVGVLDDGTDENLPAPAETDGVPCDAARGLHVWFSQNQRAGQPCKCGARNWNAGANGSFNEVLQRVTEIERRLTHLEYAR